MISKKEASRWVRSVNITDPQKHPQHDFTVYKVLLHLVPISPTDDEIEVAIYKRYNDFKKLYLTLSTYHKKIQRHENFPELVKANFFDRHDPTVIEERRSSAETVLNFCCQHFYLYSHDVFRLFFEAGLKRTITSGASSSAPLSSANVLPRQEPPPDVLTCTLPNNPSADCFHEVGIQDGAHSCPVPMIPQTIPFRDSLRSNATDDGLDNLSQATYSSDREASQLSDLILPSVPPPLVTEWDDEHNSDTEDLSASQHEINYSDLSMFDPCCSIDPINTNNESSTSFSNFSELSKSSLLPTGNFNDASKENSNLLTDISAGLTDSEETYLHQAAAYVSRAELLEACQDWNEAFNAYKMAVAVLLQGVQGDIEPGRRQMVRLYTATYLDKAETIHKTYLIENSCNLQNVDAQDSFEDRWAMTNNCVGLSMNTELISLYSPVNQLKRYKVLGIIGRVQLVFDKSNNSSYVIKCIRKSPLNSNNQTCCSTVVAAQVPYMVRLYQIIDTPDCIFLVLEHTTGSLLTDWIREYTRRDLDDPNTPGGDDFSRYTFDPSDSRIYEGRSLLKNRSSGCSQRLSTDYLPGGNSNIDFTSPENNAQDIEPVNDIWGPSQEVDCSSSDSSVSNGDDQTAVDVHADSYVALFRQVSEPCADDSLVSSTPTKQIQSVDSWGSLNITALSEPTQEKSVSVSSFSNVLNNAINHPLGQDAFATGKSAFTLRSEDSVVSNPGGGDGEVVGQRTPDSVFENESVHRSLTKRQNMGLIKEDIADNSVRPSRHSIGESQRKRSSIVSPTLAYRRSISNCVDEVRSLDNEDRVRYRRPSESLNIKSRSNPDVDNLFAERLKHSYDAKDKDGLIFEKNSNLSKSLEDIQKRRWSAAFEQFGRFDNQELTNKVPENCMKQWAAELVTAIGALHKKGVILRDLHRENVLLGPGGHLRLTFFSQWSQSPPDAIWQLGRHVAEQGFFVAPELHPVFYQLSVLASVGDNSAAANPGKTESLMKSLRTADWWSAGVVLYEMFTYCALAAMYPQGLNSHSRLYLPDWLSTEAADLLTQLLKVNPNERLGGGDLDADEIKLHPFFTGINWDDIDANGYNEIA